MDTSRREVLLATAGSVAMTAGCTGLSGSSPPLRVVAADMEQLDKFTSTVNPTVFEYPKRRRVTITGIESDTSACPELTWDVSPRGESARTITVSTDVVNRGSCADDDVRVEMFPYRISVLFYKFVVGGEITVRTSKNEYTHSLTGYRGLTELS